MGRLVTVTVILALVALSLLIYVQLDVPVSKVRINGLIDDAQRQQVSRVVARTMDGGLLSADLERLQAAILDLAWPRTVSIRRAWPGTLHIEVAKPMVVARWQDDYLASDGAVVKLPGLQQNLPVFDCRFSEPKAAMEIFHGLSEASRLQDLRITGLQENELGEWSLTFEGGLRLVLGADHLTERMERFLAVYGRHLAELRNEIAYVDARYDNGVAVRWSVAAPPGELMTAGVSAQHLDLDQL